MGLAGSNVAGFDFLWLREHSGDTTTHHMAVWWHDYQLAESDIQEKLLKGLDKQRAKAIAKEKASKTEDAAKKPKKPKAKSPKLLDTGENT